MSKYLKFQPNRRTTTKRMLPLHQPTTPVGKR